MQKLIMALAKAKLEFKKVFKSKVANILTKSGKHYSYSYAPLDEIIDAIVPALSGHGLVIIHNKDVQDGSLWLITHLFHESGEVICNKFPLPKTEDPQVLAASITYGRRYNICELLDIAADEDTDALPATDKQPVQQQNHRQQVVEKQPVSQAQPVKVNSNKNAERVRPIRELLGISKEAAQEWLKREMKVEEIANLTPEQVDYFILALAVTYAVKLGIKAEVAADIFNKHVPYLMSQGFSELDAIKEWMNYLNNNLLNATSKANPNNQRIKQIRELFNFDVRAIKEWLKFEMLVNTPAELSTPQMEELIEWIGVEWAKKQGVQVNHAVNSFRKHVLNAITQGHEEIQVIKQWIQHIEQQALTLAKA